MGKHSPGGGAKLRRQGRRAENAGLFVLYFTNLPPSSGCVPPQRVPSLRPSRPAGQGRTSSVQGVYKAYTYIYPRITLELR